MKNNKSFILLSSLLFLAIALREVRADMPSIGGDFKYDHPAETVTYYYITIFALLSFVVGFSLVILGRIRRNKKSEQAQALKNNDQK